MSSLGGVRIRLKVRVGLRSGDERGSGQQQMECESWLWWIGSSLYVYMNQCTFAILSILASETASRLVWQRKNREHMRNPLVADLIRLPALPYHIAIILDPPRICSPSTISCSVIAWFPTTLAAPGPSGSIPLPSSFGFGRLSGKFSDKAMTQWGECINLQGRDNANGRE